MAGLYDLLIQNAAAQSRTAPPAPSIKDTTEPAPPMTAEQVDLATTGEAMLGAQAGWEQTKGMTKGALAAAADAVGNRTFGKAMRTSANANMAEAQDISSYSTAPKSLKDVGGVGDFLDFARFGVPQQAPQLGAMAGAALVGRGAGVAAMGVGLNTGAQYLDGNAEIDELRTQNLVTPEREEQLRSQVLEKSGMAGVLMGALDRVGFGAVAPRLVGGVARALPKQVIKAMGAEGGTELVQEYIGNVATKLALEQPEAYGITPDEMWQLADAGVLGGLTGGAAAIPGGSFSRVGQGIDTAVDLAGAATQRFRRDDGAAAAGVDPNAPAGPSTGGKLGMALRGLVDTDPEVVRQAFEKQLDAVMANEYVQRGVQEGKDFLGELRKSSRLQKVDAFEQQIADGFKQFADAYGANAETDNLEAAYTRYKEMVSRAGLDFSKADPAKAGAAAGAAVAGFNSWLGRTEAAARSIFEGAQEGFNNPGEQRTTFGPEGSGYEAAATAGEFTAAATDFAKSAAETVGRYAQKAAAGTKEAFKAAAEAMRKEQGPIEGAEYTVDNIAGELPADLPGKKSVVGGNDVKIIERTFIEDLGAKDSDAVRYIARKLAPYLTDNKKLTELMTQPGMIQAFKDNLGLYPHQFAAQLYLNLRAYGMDTEAESLGYMGMAPAESTLNELYGKAPTDEQAVETDERVDENEDTGVSEVETETLADAKAEVGSGRIGELQRRALAPGEANKAAFERMRANTERSKVGSKRWVIQTRTVKDPATGEVIEQGSEPVELNMMDVAMAESGARQGVEGQTIQQRKDQDWMAGIGSLFNGWQETDEQGRTVEVSLQPGKAVSFTGPDGKRQYTGEPVDVPLDQWIRDREAIGPDRTFKDLKKDNRANKPLQNPAAAVDGYLSALAAAKEAGVADTGGYDAALINAAVNAVRDARFPQDLRMATPEDLKAYEQELLGFVDWIDNSMPTPAVDAMWALLRDPGMPAEVKDVLLANLGRAIAQDDVTQMHTTVEESASNLKLMRRELIATPPEERGTPSFVQGAQNYARGVSRLVSDALGADNKIPAALALLPSDIVKKQDDNGQSLVGRRLFGALRNAEEARTSDEDITANPTQPAADQPVYGRYAHEAGKNGPKLRRDDPRRVEQTRLIKDEVNETQFKRNPDDPKDRSVLPVNVTAPALNKVTGYTREAGTVRNDDGSRAQPINTISGKGGLRMYDDDGVQKESLSGEYIDYNKTQAAGRRALKARSVVKNTREAALSDAAPEVAAEGPKGQAAPSGSGKKYSLYRSEVGKQLERTLAENGFALEAGVPDPNEVGTLIDIARKTVQMSSTPESLQQAAAGLSMLMVGHKDFEALRPALQETALYKRHFAEVKGTQSRADQEAARRTLADLISRNFAQRADINADLMTKLRTFAERVWKMVRDLVTPAIEAAVDKMVDKMLNERGYLNQPDKPGYEPVNFQAAVDSDPLAGAILASLSKTPAQLTGSLAYAAKVRVLRPKNAAIHDLDFKVNSSDEAHDVMRQLIKDFPGTRRVNAFKERGGYEVGTLVVPPKGTRLVALTKNSYRLVDDAGKQVGWFEKTSEGDRGEGVQGKLVDIFVDPNVNNGGSTQKTFRGPDGKEHSLAIYNVTDGVAAKLRILRPKDIWDYQKYNPRVKQSLYEGEGGLDLTTPEGRDEARRRIREIAGDVGISFGKENSYDPEGHLITLAVSRFADLGTAYHEALHSIFKAIDANDKKTLYAGLNTMHVKNQLKRLMKDSPAAIEAAMNDPEELAAYAFQFYKRGMLQLGPETKTWFDKLLDAINKARDWLLDQPNHEELFQRIAEGYYKNGGPSPVELAVLRESKGATRRILSDTARGLLATYDRLLSAVDDRLRDSGVSELTDIAKDFYTQVGEKADKRGLAQDIPIMTNVWMNKLAKTIGSDAPTAARALEAMALGDESSPKAKEFRTFLNQMRAYMKQAGVDIGYIQGYLPMQWSGDKIADDEDGFKAMLGKYRKELAEIGLTPDKAWGMMSQRNITSAIPSGDVFDPDGKPTMWHTQERVFSFLSAEDRRPYVEDNLIGTMGQYVKQAVKRAEWERRFPGNSWEVRLRAAEKRGASAEDIAIAKDLKEAVFGAKYNRMSPTWRRALGAMQTYQNVRVLGLGLFSSLGDPLLLGIRTGDFKEAWGAFKYGLRHIYKAPEGDLATLAEDIGAVNDLGDLDSLMTLYGGFEVEGNLKHVNDMLFKYNGLEGLTRGLRVYAAGAGVRFIQRADARQLAELGLKSDDLKYMPDGTLAVRGSQFKELGMSNREATDAALQMQRALNRFVDESVLRPNASERPKWANDPVFALLFHLKQFIFSFHKIVTKKVMHEFEEGNMQPATYLTAAAFVPLMAATGYVKDAIRFAGEVPVDRDFMHYFMQGVNRSGFMGPSVLASEVGADLMSGRNPLGSVGGPTASQALEAAQALANPEQFGRFVEEAMPLSTIYKDWFKGEPS